MHLVKTISNPLSTSKWVWVYCLCFAWSQVTWLIEISMSSAILPSRNFILCVEGINNSYERIFYSATTSLSCQKKMVKPWLEMARISLSCFSWVYYSLADTSHIWLKYDAITHSEFFAFWCTRVCLGTVSFCALLLVMKIDPPCFRCLCTLRKSTCSASWTSTWLSSVSKNKTWNSLSFFFLNSAIFLNVSAFIHKLLFRTIATIFRKIYKTMWLWCNNHTA